MQNSRSTGGLHRSGVAVVAFVVHLSLYVSSSIGQPVPRHSEPIEYEMPQSLKRIMSMEVDWDDRVMLATAQSVDGKRHSLLLFFGEQGELVQSHELPSSSQGRLLSQLNQILYSDTDNRLHQLNYDGMEVSTVVIPFLPGQPVTSISLDNRIAVGFRLSAVSQRVTSRLYSMDTHNGTFVMGPGGWSPVLRPQADVVYFVDSDLRSSVAGGSTNLWRVRMEDFGEHNKPELAWSGLYSFIPLESSQDGMFICGVGFQENGLRRVGVLEIDKRQLKWLDLPEEFESLDASRPTFGPETSELVVAVNAGSEGRGDEIDQGAALVLLRRVGENWIVLTRRSVNTVNGMGWSCDKSAILWVERGERDSILALPLDSSTDGTQSQRVRP